MYTVFEKLPKTQGENLGQLIRGLKDALIRVWVITKECK